MTTLSCLVVLALLRLCTLPGQAATDVFATSFQGSAVSALNFTCPTECRCYKVNQTNSRPLVWISCSVSQISQRLSSLILQMSSPDIGYLVLTCGSSLDLPQDMTPQSSSLWEGAFKTLSQLRALIFEGCKFQKVSRNGFRGLSSMSELTFRSASIDDLDLELLAYMPQLTVLEISQSSLRQLFPLCQAGHLRALNVSNNRILSWEAVGLRCASGALPHLETLDVSGNHLTTLPTWLHHSLPNLYHLSLASNYVSDAGTSPFESLSRLSHLDLSNNSFTSFNNDFFRGCQNLVFLDLSSNRVSSLPRGLLSDLSALQHLHLDAMGLDDRVWIEIPDLWQLISLNMSDNRLTLINPDVMSQFMKLEILYLSNNKIAAIPSTAFEYQLKMNTIDLSFNEISNVQSQVFRNQYGLKQLYLHHNNMTTLGHEALSQLQELLTLDLGHNSLSYLPSKVFHGLTKVTHLDLSYNNLTYIDAELFSKNLQLTYLNLSRNHLTEFGVLNYMNHLKTIDASYNRISSLNPSGFTDLRELREVFMSHNEIKTVPIKLLKGCDGLLTLDFSFNKINALEEAIFSSLTRVQSLNLSHNDIPGIGMVFSGLKDLDTLDLSFNKIDKILRGQFPHFIKFLNLRGNMITFITAHTFKSLNRIRVVDLSDNKLTSLQRMDLEIAFNLGYIPNFNLQNNPFVCDCQLGWLKDWSSGNLKDSTTLPHFELSPSLTCSSPLHDGRQSMQDLPRSDFLCRYSSYCEDSCMCCDYACYCKYVCPSSCRCYIGDDVLRAHHVQCNSANLTSVPAELPEGATDLRLDGNTISTLERHQFLALKHVQFLYLNHSQITLIQNNTFKGLKSVRALYLNNNYISAVYSITFQGLDSLEALYLQNNDIYFIDVQGLLNLPSLNIANLQNNALSSVPIDDILQLRNSSKFSETTKINMFLGGNPWSCEPEFSCKFFSFLQVQSLSIVDVSTIECVYSTINEKDLAIHHRSSLILDLQLDLCSNNQSTLGNMTWQNLKAFSPSTEAYALIGVCLIIIFTVTFLIVAYTNRHLLQVLLFSRFGLRFFQNSANQHEDMDRPYDAFISYCDKDENFVAQQLVPYLENGQDKNYKLCVHFRDFPMGGCIAGTIMRSMEASKRIILVVSNNFLDSDWCRFEFQTAHQQAQRDDNNRLIFILLHNLHPDKISEPLKYYTTTRTYLKYSDPWFWEKLHFSMPEIPRHKSEMSSPLHTSRDIDYTSRQMSLLQHQHPHQLQHQHPHQLMHQNPHQLQHQHLHLLQHQHNHLYPPLQVGQAVPVCRNGALCNDVYEVPVLESGDFQYHLASGSCCSPHTNSAYHYSDCSDHLLCYHSGSISGSCCHYEEVGPAPPSLEILPHKQTATQTDIPPPPIPSLPIEGFVPIHRPLTFRV